MFFISLFLFSCGYQENNNATWVFAVYMAGDNNLSDYATLDLKEMMDTGSNDNVKVVVLCDRGEGTTFYEVKKGWLEPVKQYGNLNTGDSATLSLFLNDIKSRYSYQKMALVFWDHGDGWQDAAFDDSSRSFLKMSEIKRVLDAENFHVDFLGFDECLAGMAEVFYTFKDDSNVTVASEAAEPGFGWNYKDLIERLKKNYFWDGEDLGKAAVDSYYQFYSNKTAYCQPDCTLAAVTAKNATDITYYINLLASYGLNGTASLLQDYYGARNNSLEPEPVYFPFYVDLYSFAQNLNATTTDLNVKTAAINLMSVIGGIYFKSTNSTLKGVSIYFPNDTYDYFDTYFNASINEFAETLWDDFLIKYYGVLP
ncbi:clostripain-related cysteine peptidase [Desulfurobacterium sp.]